MGPRTEGMSSESGDCYNAARAYVRRGDAGFIGARQRYSLGTDIVGRGVKGRESNEVSIEHKIVVVFDARVVLSGTREQNRRSLYAIAIAIVVGNLRHQ